MSIKPYFVGQFKKKGQQILWKKKHVITDRALRPEAEDSDSKGKQK